MGNTHGPKPTPMRTAGHPHTCGEHARFIFGDPSSFGSSPRMWGTPHIVMRGRDVIRVIPTHVGNTSTAHPRSRPRVIPTHVGNTPLAVPRAAIISGHPHACGEHAIVDEAAFVDNGSSPRMWGTLCAFHDFTSHVRVIPTHVGNTALRPELSWCAAGHPHACGEHVTSSTRSASPYGSSPRMWGTPPPESIRRSLYRGHPHACGEHPMVFSTAMPIMGSSPRMWGTPAIHNAVRRNTGVIPTHVGNTPGWKPLLLPGFTSKPKATAVLPDQVAKYSIVKKRSESAFRKGGHEGKSGPPTDLADQKQSAAKGPGSSDTIHNG